jgi:hypothetical protein
VNALITPSGNGQLATARFAGTLLDLVLAPAA